MVNLPQSLLLTCIATLLFCPTSGKTDEWNWINTGPPVRYGILALTFDPGGSYMYAGSDEGWLFKSNDRGATWDQLWGSDISVTNPGAVKSIVVNPHRWNELYVVAGALFHSEDAGETWSPFPTPFHVGALPYADGIVFDPRQDGVIYGHSGRLFKSIDHGATWADISPDDNVYTLAISPHNSNLLLAGAWASFTGGDPDTWGNTGLFKSDDGGISWMIPTLPSTTARIRDIEFDPVRPHVIYAGGWHSHRGERTGVIFKSEDGGNGWTTIFELEESSISDLAIDPYMPDVMYAGSAQKVQETGLFRSTDGGATWVKIHEGGPTTVIVDPHDSGTLYVAMREGIVGGVYRFSLFSSKTAVEEVSWGILKRLSTSPPGQD